MSRKISIPDAMDAMQRNVTNFLTRSGHFRKVTVTVAMDEHSGTASISHNRIRATGAVLDDIACSVQFPVLPAQGFIADKE